MCIRDSGGGLDGRWQLAGRVVSLEYLWNAVRVQGGAYGTGMVTRVLSLIHISPSLPR